MLAAAKAFQRLNVPGPAFDPQVPDIRQFGEVLEQARAASLVTPLDAEIALIVGTSRSAAARGEVRQARELLERGTAAAADARSAGVHAQLLMALADLAAAPGDPLTLGFSLAVDRLVRTQLRTAQSAGDVIIAPDTLTASDTQYAQLERLVPAPDQFAANLALRRAWVTYVKGDYVAARTAFDRAASIAARNENRLIASLSHLGAALASGDIASLNAAFNVLEPTDRSTAVTISEVVQSWAARRWAVGHDAIAPLAMLAAVADRLQQRQLPQATVACIQQADDILIATDRAERAIVETERGLELQRAVVAGLQRQQAAAPSIFTNGPLQTALQVQVELLNALRAALSRQFTEDSSSVWGIRLAATMRELTTLQPSLDQGALLQNGTLGVMAFNGLIRDALLATSSPGGCKTVLAEIDRTRDDLAAHGNEFLALAVAWGAVTCDPGRRSALEAATTTMNPAASLRTAFDNRVRTGSAEDALRWVGTAGQTAALLSAATEAGMTPLVSQWLDELSRLPAAATSISPLSDAITRSRSAIFETTGRVAESRQLLRSLVRDTEPPSQARVTASQQLLDFEIREGNPKLAFTALIDLERLQSRWLLARSGLGDPTADSAKLGMLDARAARGDILTAQEQSERSVLQQRPLRPRVPLGRDLTADEIIKRLPGGTTLLVYLRDPTRRHGVAC